MGEFKKENAFAYAEFEDYFQDFLKENLDYLKENNANWRDELHHEAFNTSYYIIGIYQAKQWLGSYAFDVVGIVKRYEEMNFGGVTTDLSCPERVVNMYAYIVGEEIVNDWLQANPEEEDKEALEE